MAKKAAAKRTAKTVVAAKQETPVEEVESSVIPLEEVVIEDAGLLEEGDPADANDIQQISTENVDQEKVPKVEEDAKDADIVSTGEDGKMKDASKEENAGASRLEDDRINPEFIVGRRSEYPRG
jgi:hypothetical protein